MSATSRQGLEALEEALLLQAELMDIRADVTREAEAVVLEARQDKGQGPLASMIVKCGTLKPGAHLVVGQLWGKVRALRDMSGKLVKAAGPSMPVEVLGLKGLPETGDEVLVVASEERARKIAEGRAMQADRKKRDSTVMVRGFGFLRIRPGLVDLRDSSVVEGSRVCVQMKLATVCEARPSSQRCRFIDSFAAGLSAWATLSHDICQKHTKRLVFDLKRPMRSFGFSITSHGITTTGVLRGW